MHTQNINGYQLSPQQRVLHRARALNPDAFACRAVIGIEGPLDPTTLEAALVDLVDRHEILRTRFERFPGMDFPLQVIEEEVAPALPFEDLAHLDAAERDARVTASLEDMAETIRDLAAAPPLRFRLIRAGYDRHLLLLCFSSLLGDRAATEIMVRELAVALAGYQDDEALEPLQYVDLAGWLTDMLHGEENASGRDLWQRREGDEPLATHLPWQIERGEGPFQPRCLTTHLAPAVAAEFQAWCAAHERTPEHVVFAIWSLLAARHGGPAQTTVGYEFHGRKFDDLRDALGRVAHQLPIPVQTDSGTRFDRYLDEIEAALDRATTAAESFTWELPGYESEWPGGGCALAFEPVVASDAVEVGGLRLHLVSFAGYRQRFAAMLECESGSDRLGLKLHFNASCMDPATALWLADRVTDLLEQVPQRARASLASWFGPTEQERREILVAYNRAGALPTEAESVPAGDLPVHRAFEAQAAARPDATAVVFDTESLSYAELDRRANRLAHHLRAEHGIGPERLVGICMTRSLDMVVAILGVLKAGGAWLPLDPESPQQRLAFSLADAGAELCLTHATTQTALDPAPVTTLCLNAFEVHSQGSEDDLDISIAAANTAYCIYTSGSTGTPKGVANTHEGLANRIAWMQRTYNLGHEDRVLQKTPFCFDVSIWELFWPLTTGAVLVMAHPDAHRDPHLLAEEIRRHRVTTLHFVPPMLDLFLEQPIAPPSLRRLIVGGEALTAQLRERVYRAMPDVALHQSYGPTEASIAVCHFDCHPDDRHDPIPIGHPVSRTRLHILDEHLAPLPAGRVGELYIGGICLARGYHHRPGLTAASFVPDPFEGPGARLYRTGDLARYQPDGSIVFVGRRDHQVKLRGFRIELGEVAAVLRTVAGVREAIADVIEEPDGAPQLTAWLTVGSEAPDKVGIRETLATSLPEYMVPVHLVVLECMPLTRNGKIDRAALPRPQEEARAQVAPRNPTEETLAMIWADVLDRDRVGVHQNFFDLGGHSLMATRVIARARDAFKVNLSVRHMFQAPTIAELAELVAAASTEEGLQTTPIEPAPRDKPLPLSFAQQRLWFLDQFAENPAAYNIPGALRLTGPLDADALGWALGALIERHESLRTRFVADSGRPCQHIDPPGAFDLPLTDLTSLSPDAAESEMRALMETEATHRFDLSGERLIRARLLRLAERDHVLLVTVHHIVSDGWSTGILIREVAEAYRARVAGRAPRLQTPSIQYGDFAYWQRSMAAGAELARQRDYWRGQLADCPTMLRLPTDRARPAVQRFGGDQIRFSLPGDLRDRLVRVARASGATLFMTLLGGFKLLLSRYAHQRDIVVGTPIAGRGRPELEPLIGIFVNTLVLRTQIPERGDFGDLLALVREATLAAFANQDVPFEQLVEELQPNRDLAHTPLFQVLFVLQNTPEPESVLPDLQLTPMDIGTRTARFDLTLSMVETATGLRGTLEYRTDLWDRATVERLLAQFQTLLSQIGAGSDRPLHRLSPLTEAERRQVSRLNNEKKLALPAENAIAGFLRQARERPQATALVQGATQWRYAELQSRVDRLAGELVASGIGPGHRVGGFLTTAPELAIATLAVLRAGAVWLPLNPEYPAARIEAMLADAEPGLILTSEAVACRVPGTVPTLCLDAASRREPADDEAIEVSFPNPLPDQPAYVTYTVDPNGHLAGVVISHRGLANRLGRTIADDGIAPDDRVLVTASCDRDQAICDALLPLAAGGAAVFGDADLHRDPAQIIAAVEAHDVTRLHLAPSMLQLVLEMGGPDRLSSLRGLRVVGETPSPDLIDRCRQILGIEPFCSFGPVEASGDATEGRAHAGLPVANTRVYVLDAGFHPAPHGAFGALAIAGEGLAAGYLNRPALTAARFLPDPFAEEPGARLFLTGDIGRMTDAGLELCDRIDDRITLRGMPIHPAEITRHLKAQHGVRDAWVGTAESAAGEPMLVAYLVLELGVAPEPGFPRDALERVLPGDAVPAVFVFLDALPRTAGGTVAQRLLPPPQQSVDTPYAAPTSEPEQEMAALWHEVLGIEPIGLHDHFFHMGGHALTAARLVARIREHFGIALPVRAVHDSPTVAGLLETLLAHSVADADEQTLHALLDQLERESGEPPNPNATHHDQPADDGSAPSGTTATTRASDLPAMRSGKHNTNMEEA